MKHLKAVFLVILGWAFMLTAHAYATETIVEQYIKTPDSSYEYRLVNTVYSLFYTTYIFELTSQEWHPDEVRPKRWKHWLTVVEPRLLGEYTEYIPFFSLVKTNIAILTIIEGDSEHEDAPTSASTQAVQLAVRNRAIVAELHGVPIGPVAFLDEQKDTNWWDDLNPFRDEDEDKVLRREDSFQVRSLDLALETGDFTWALMAPMTKAVIGGMDAIQNFMMVRTLGFKAINKFVLTGHSKRGWTAWLTAAMDSRVAAIAPISFDLINIPGQIALQEESWNELSPELGIYQEFDLYERFKTPTGMDLIANIDPLAYFDRIDIPVFILSGTNDNYSPVDGITVYLNDLQGEARIFYAPNKGHFIQDDPEVLDALAAFYRHIIEGQAMPEISWSYANDGSFEMTPLTRTPIEVKLWTAANHNARDFRETAGGIPWTAAVLEENQSGSYAGTVEIPAAGGYVAFYIELTYQDGKETDPPYTLATPIKVLGE